MESILLTITKDEWTHYLTRPFSLFGSSLWYEWYATYASKFTSYSVADTLCVEESTGVVRNYRRTKDLVELQKTFGGLAITKKSECEALLKKGFDYNTKAEEYLKGEKIFSDLQTALEFFYETATHATIVPHFVLKGLEREGEHDEVLESLAEKLRSTSYYPRLYTEIIMPLGIKKLQELGVQNPETAIDLLTINEVVAGDTSYLSQRMQARKDNLLFVYSIIGGNTTIDWQKDTATFIATFENIDFAAKECKGASAYKGKVTGIAKVVTSIDGAGVDFNQGDILISINSNPNLMPLITKAAAIVTDEGGITCHAAIVSRELKIPCIIGTRIATKIIKTGDRVIVDADTGVVTIL